MGSGSKAQTIGYRYLMGLHAVLHLGVSDKITRLFFDNQAPRVAWEGEAASGTTIVVDQPNLFGGDDREGGVSGSVDVMGGEPTQGINAWLALWLGPFVSAFRGVTALLYRGGTNYGDSFYWGNNPYIKTFGGRSQRIHLTTDAETQWYDAKAAIPITGEVVAPPTTVETVLPFDENWHYLIEDTPYSGADFTAPSYDHSSWTQAPGGFGTQQPIGGSPWAVGTAVPSVAGRRIWLRKTVSGVGMTNLHVKGAGDDTFAIYWNGVLKYTNTFGNFNVTIADADILPENTLALLVQDATPSGGNIFAALQLEYDFIELAPSAHFDMNPSHIIRECLTDPDWGMGYQAADVDDDSFIAAADTLYSEGMGISLIWDKQMPLEDFVKEIIKHIDAALFVDRKTGKFTLVLIRDDYDEGDLITLDEDTIDKVDNFKRAAFDELTNSVTVNHWDYITGNDASLTIQDIALEQMQGGATINATLQYPGFTHYNIASRVAQRDLKALSTPLISCVVYANRSAAKELRVGSVFKLTWPDYQLNEVIMRVTNAAYGDGKSNQIRLTCLQDVFGLPDAVFQQPSQPEWEDPLGEVEALTKRLAIELPYLELVQREGQSSVDSALSSDPNVAYVGIAAARENSLINATMLTDSGAGYTEVGTLDFAPNVTLVNAIGYTETQFIVSDVAEVGLVAGETLMQFGNELMAFVSYRSGDSVLTVKRGALDTVPIPHSAGEVGFIWGESLEADPTEYVTSDVVNIKLLSSNGSDKLLEADAPVDTVTAVGRAAKPYAPGNFKVDGVSFGYLFAGDCELTWAHRDRKQQTSATFANYTDGNIGPEAGVTYSVDIYGDANEFIKTVSGITDAGFTYTAAQETIDMGGTSDAYYANVVLLLQMDGADGSTTFTDAKGKTATVTGNAQIDTADSDFPTGAGLWDGSGDVVSFADHADFDFGSGDLTMEGYAKAVSGTSRCLVSKRTTGTAGWAIEVQSDGSIRLRANIGGVWSDNKILSAAGAMTFGVKFHWSLTRLGNLWTFWVNGASVATLTASGALSNQASSAVRLGRSQSSAESDYSGWQKAVRLTKGVCRYTAPFTPPPFPLPETASSGLNNELRFIVKAVRAGLESYTHYDWTVKRSGVGTVTGYGNYYGNNYGA